MVFSYPDFTPSSRLNKALNNSQNPIPIHPPPTSPTHPAHPAEQILPSRVPLRCILPKIPLMLINGSPLIYILSTTRVPTPAPMPMTGEHNLLSLSDARDAISPSVLRMHPLCTLANTRVSSHY
ncbi:hypothetical protein Q7P37_005718 [Cladosporium fusiforme]